MDRPENSKPVLEEDRETLVKILHQMILIRRFEEKCAESYSLGIACFPNNGETTEELLTAAAGSMQRDKHSRKNLHNLSTLPTPARIDHYT